MSVCRKQECSAPIVWAQRHDNRAVSMPIDVGSEDDAAGEYAIWMDGIDLKYRKLAKGEEPGEGERRAVSHYRTCTSPDEFSRKRKPAR